MPAQLTSVYSTYEDVVNKWLEKISGPEEADRLIMRSWGQSSVGSATLQLATKYDWPLFVSGVVITAHEAESPNARYLNTLLDALTDFQANDTDYEHAGEEKARNDLERIWKSARSA